MIKLIDEAKKLFGWEGLFVTHTAEEWLWGYDDPLLKLLHGVLPCFIPSYHFGLAVSTWWLASNPGLLSQLFSQPWKKKRTFFHGYEKKLCGKAWVRGYMVVVSGS